MAKNDEYKDLDLYQSLKDTIDTAIESFGLPEARVVFISEMASLMPVFIGRCLEQASKTTFLHQVNRRNRRQRFLQKIEREEGFANSRISYAVGHLADEYRALGEELPREAQPPPPELAKKFDKALAEWEKEND